MEVSIQGIREIFSKASVSFSRTGIAVYYTYDERWVSQSISDERKRMLSALISKSDEFHIDCVNGKFVRFLFCHGYEGMDFAFYCPVEKEVSLEELKRLVREAQETEQSERFFSFMSDVNTNERSEIMRKLSEWISEVDGNQETRYGSRAIWEIKRLATILCRKFKCEYNLINPSFDFDGCVEIQFPAGMRTKLIGENKDIFNKLVDISSDVDIECLISEGYLNITFNA